MWNPVKYGLIWCYDRIIILGFNPVLIQNASTVTRLFFLCISCCSFLLGSYLITLQIEEYHNQFFITKIDTPNLPVWKFRFPSITVCSFNVVYKKNIKNLMHVVTSRGIKEEAFMDFIEHLSCLIVYDNCVYNKSDYEEVYAVLQQSGYNIDQIMAELAPPCSSMVRRCFWRAQEVPCSKIIQTEKTRLGYCCSFNYYGSRKIARNIEDPYNKQFTYLGLSGLTYGLRLFLDVEKYQYVSSIKPKSYGFNVLVQDGADYLNPDQMPTDPLRAGEELKIAVSPNIHVTTANVRNMRVERRKCLYEDEGHLEWSPIYSFHTCMNECRAKAITELCNCTPFFYPFESYTRICNLSDVHCLYTQRQRYASLRIPENFLLADDEEQTKDEDNERYFYCQCYPQCDKKIYNFQAFTSKIASLAEYENSNLSVLSVYYNDIECIKIEKDVSYTWYTLLAKIGGIFSLCLGSSLISIVECFYFFGKTLSNCSKLKQKTKVKTNKLCLHTYVVQPHGSEFKNQSLNIHPTIPIPSKSPIKLKRPPKYTYPTATLVTKAPRKIEKSQNDKY